MHLGKRDESPVEIKGVNALFALDESLDSDIDNQQVLLASIRLPKQQPRRYFDPEKLAQLATSIKEHGIIEPLLVRPLLNDEYEYELVAGERRYRAAKKVGLETVPIVIRELNDDEALQLTLEENLQREDLNPVEETEGILQLLALRLEIEPQQIIPILNAAANAKLRDRPLMGNVSHQLEIIEKTLATLGKGTPESFRTSKLPLLNLPTEVLEALRQGKLAYTKARAIARLKDEGARQTLLTEAIEGNLSLTQIKGRAKELTPAKTEERGEQEQEPNLKQKFKSASRKLEKSKVWDDPKRSKKLEQLLKQIEKFLEN